MRDDYSTGMEQHASTPQALKQGPKQFPDTLCISCGKACGGCSWADSLTPVDGWTAERSYDSDGNPYSWLVIDCPEYRKEDPQHRRPPADQMNTEGCMQLLTKAMEIARKDFISDRDARRSVAAFIRNWLPDPEDVIGELKKAAREHDEAQEERERRRHQEI